MKTYLELLNACEEAFREYQRISHEHDRGSAPYERAKAALFLCEEELEAYCDSHAISREKMWRDMRQRYGG